MASTTQNMDDATQEYWQSYINILKDHMKLRDWEVILVRDAPEKDSWEACIGVFFGQRWAELCLNLPLFLTRTPAEQKATIVHELLHLHTEGTKDLIHKWCSEGEENQTNRFFWNVYYEKYEIETETLALILSPWLPDPEVQIGDPPHTMAGY